MWASENGAARWLERGSREDRRGGDGALGRVARNGGRPLPTGALRPSRRRRRAHDRHGSISHEPLHLELKPDLMIYKYATQQRIAMMVVTDDGVVVEVTTRLLRCCRHAWLCLVLSELVEAIVKEQRSSARVHYRGRR